MEWVNPKVVRVPERERPPHGVSADNAAYHRLVELLQKDGLRLPVFVRKSGLRLELVEGYYRLSAALDAGLRRVPVLFAKTLADCDLARCGPVGESEAA